MKKTLIALAVLGALPVFAQAQTSVQLTGSIDVAVESLNKDANGGNKSDLQVNDGIWGGSRFGIKGSEELGNGLKGIFALEYRGNADDGTMREQNVFWRGESWVGLDGGFGTLRLGRQDSPLELALDDTGDMTGGDWYYNGGSLADMSGTINNSVAYDSPSFGGLKLYAMYGAGEATAPAGNDDLNKLGDFYGIGARGEWGGFAVGLGYQVTDGADINNIKNTNELGASIGTKLGGFGVGVTYVQVEEKRVAGANVKNKGAAASLSYEFSDANTAYLSYRREDPQGADNVEDGVGLTFVHGLSKRTFVYAAAGIGKEQQGPNAEDLKPRRFALGVRHFF